ncbi:MAG: hypothetical protein V4793_40535 [Paraburkholderia tropica]|uniref:hypothetical protein n=1 Tax=Paraburkholderia TaxID=1822464 RepID=UPI00197D9D3C|nr:hypothetical protein [Paraburkholderia sp. Ac-20347]MBN3808768.1 hypothetical protein [Paraburkholderia sp. Ac-20347]
MKQIFIKRNEAIRLLIKKRATNAGAKPPRVQPAGSDIATAAALERLLLDVRAGRINEFHLDGGDDGPDHIVITN